MEKLWFAFLGSGLLLEKRADGTYTVPRGEYPPEGAPACGTVHRVAAPGGAEARAYRIAEAPGDSRHEVCDLRESYGKLPLELYLEAGKCEEILHWDENTRFCGACGGRMLPSTDISKRCPACGREAWPQLAIAVIVLISKGEECLLVKARNFRRDFYGLVAGFVETGETLEQAVHREVMEETGLVIRDLRYFGSQPWPYPSGLMVGFTAEYESGEIRLQESELADGGWFGRDRMPNIPERLSIARRLIDNWLEGGR